MVVQRVISSNGSNTQVYDKKRIQHEDRNIYHTDWEALKTYIDSFLKVLRPVAGLLSTTLLVLGAQALETGEMLKHLVSNTTPTNTHYHLSSSQRNKNNKVHSTLITNAKHL